MATLVLSAAGQAAGALLGPVGAVVGKAAGAIGGSFVDATLFGGGGRERVVGKIDDLSVQTSSEGNPIPAAYGRMRLAGTVIWATPFEEEVSEQEVGGKGGGGGGGTTVREYSYFANFAVGIAEGPIARIGRVWADGTLLDLSAVNCRVYRGDEEQEPDPLILAKEGAAPAYRGLSYVVFERLPVTPFGNRLPQLTFELVRCTETLEEAVRAVTVIPGATEFGYHTVYVKRRMGPGAYESDNRVMGLGTSDFEASIDELVALCPNLERVALVVAWFGDDLNAAECRIEPRVEWRDRDVTGASWSVAGLGRGTANVVSQIDGRPAYGGTPSDEAVVAAIQALNARGIKVTFYPFILMDVPPGNGKVDPHGGAEQAPFPWRGRITVSPAAGRAGSPDATNAAAAAANGLIGTVGAGDVTVAGDGVGYTGPAEWTLSRMALHYAALCEAAGGVDAFLIGSELRGLTTIRGPADSYPFVDGLVRVAREVSAVLGSGTKVSYAADWSEFFGHQPADGSGDVFFHLDPLWADPAVDFVGIDVYWPLSDWRDGSGHLDAVAADSVYDLAYLRGNVAGGEGFDWYYRSDADRVAQVRTPITDGAGKPWVFRYKDLKGWWANRHFDRPGGVEADVATAWRPEMKPIWFTETGCPAIDRGANQPNVFYDPKSSESAVPHFSNGGRDDAMQRQYLAAILSYFGEDDGTLDERNPVSARYGGRMVAVDGVHLWTWDARPWPAFPQRLDVWSDGANWARGHWLSGRFGGTTVAGLVRALFADFGLPAPEIIGLDQAIDGFVRSRPSTLRDELEELASAFTFVGIDTGTGIRLASPDRRPTITVDRDDLVELGPDEPLVEVVRREDEALPAEQRLLYLDSGHDFAAGTARATRSAGHSRAIEMTSVAAALPDARAGEIAETALFDGWARRNRVRIALSPSRLDVEAGDLLTLTAGSAGGVFMVDDLEDAGGRLIGARAVDRQIFRPTPREGSYRAATPVPAFGPPVVHILDLPSLDGTGEAHQPYIAVWSRPFPRPMGVWGTRSGSSYDLLLELPRPATIAELVEPSAPGPFSRWHEGGALTVRLYARGLQSRDELEVLAGKNALAVQADDGRWEILQFAEATLVADRTYRLTRLLRGQGGTEDVATGAFSPGAAVVVLDRNLRRLPISRDAARLPLDLRVGPLASGHTDAAVTGVKADPAGRGLKPLSPVHLSATRLGDGAVEIAWVRRTRTGGDDWTGQDVPLGEERELYTVDILSGDSVVRRVETAEPRLLYPRDQLLADFGAEPAAITVRVAQVSPANGEGVPATAALTLD